MRGFEQHHVNPANKRRAGIPNKSQAPMNRPICRQTCQTTTTITTPFTEPFVSLYTSAYDADLFLFKALQRSAKWATAACKRDFTVPSGISRMSLICLYGN
jgi:hypothetical protein